MFSSDKSSNFGGKYILFDSGGSGDIMLTKAGINLLIDTENTGRNE